MNRILLVGIGGFVGAIARFGLGGLIVRNTVNGRFPFGTFVVNVSGCLVAGILLGLADKYDCFNSDLRLFLFTGLLGGFTTFSAFGVETVGLLQRQEITLALVNIVGSVLCGLGALWLGTKIIF